MLCRLRRPEPFKSVRVTGSDILQLSVLLVGALLWIRLLPVIKNTFISSYGPACVWSSACIRAGTVGGRESILVADSGPDPLPHQSAEFILSLQAGGRPRARARSRALTGLTR